VSWKYRGKLVRSIPGGRVFSTTSIGSGLSPEHQEIVDRIRAYQLQQLLERRENDR
jgi:hypothetical protein